MRFAGFLQQDMQHVAFHFVDGDIVAEASAIGNAFDIVCIDVSLCLGREACGCCFGAFKMGE